MKKVGVVGGSGLIGSDLIHILLKSREIEEVTALVRSPLEWRNSKYRELVIDFDKLDDYKNELTGDALYCCLGSTRKKTPDFDRYKKMDHDYPLRLAKIAEKNDIKQFHIVTALGADKNSKVVYNRLKGQTEEALKKTGLKALLIYQPSLLVGERKENRSLEKIFVGLMKIIDPFLSGKLKKYQSIKAETVAKAMLNQTFKNLKGVHIYPSDIIKELA